MNKIILLPHGKTESNIYSIIHKKLSIWSDRDVYLLKIPSKDSEERNFQVNNFEKTLQSIYDINPDIISNQLPVENLDDAIRAGEIHWIVIIDSNEDGQDRDKEYKMINTDCEEQIKLASKIYLKSTDLYSYKNRNVIWNYKSIEKGLDMRNKIEGADKTTSKSDLISSFKTKLKRVSDINEMLDLLKSSNSDFYEKIKEIAINIYGIEVN